MRLIDADAIIDDAFYLMDRDELLEDVPQIIKDYCDAQPTIDAVPVDFLKSISSRMYGKERFFRQDNGTWYDREQADYISLEEMMDRIYQQIVELDDGKEEFPEGFFEKPRRHATEEKGFDEKTCVPVTVELHGWICPICGRGLSPFTSVCPCQSGKGWEITCG